MDYFPKVRVERFNKVQPGDLFFIDLLGTWLLAIKAHEKRDDENLLAVLGPTFPEKLSPAYMVNWQAATVVVLGKDYHIELPTGPKGWSLALPAPETIALVLRDDEIYLRANCSHDPRDFSPCLIRLTDGEIVYGQARQSDIYVTNWRFSIQDENEKSYSVIRFGEG